ncbi:uncharacterized protein BJX67DRAFT_368760 [Aspergillus lucknowensis]|uniref:Uncharacterized protein n=1 Tax=Aspergillus lucknowensis TaxID=176173 RepID=A0ABR4L5I4_9EURO
METLTLACGCLRGTSSVGNRVQRLLLIGKETPEIASNTELLPEDWSPQTIIWGRETFCYSLPDPNSLSFPCCRVNTLSCPSTLF